jgi:EpsI family protein
VRVYGVILAGYLTNMQSYLVRVSHSEFGWVIFAVAMTVYFLIAVRMAPTTATATQDALARDPISIPAKANALLLGAGLALSAMAIGPIWNMAVPLDPARLPATGMLLPSHVGAWKGPQSVADADWQPLFPAADLVQMGKYSTAGKDVEMFVAAYSSQRQGKEIVSYDNSVVGKDAATLSRQDLPGHTKEVVAVAPNGHQFVVRYFYQIGSLRTDNDLQEQLHYATASLHGNPLSMAVAMSARCAPDCDAARATLEAFAAQVAMAEPQSQDHEGDRE